MKIFVRIVFLSIFCSLTIYIFIADIRAFAWHLQNPQPYVWENLEIEVPSKFIETHTNPKSHYIISPFKEIQGAVVLTKHDPDLMKPYGDLLVKEKFKGKGVKELKCNIPGFPCYRYLVKNYSEKKMGEIVLLENEGVELRYIGDLKSKVYFDEILRSLRKHVPEQ